MSRALLPMTSKVDKLSMDTSQLLVTTTRFLRLNLVTKLSSRRTQLIIVVTMVDTARLRSVNSINDAGYLNEVDIVSKNPDRNREARDFPVNPTSALTLFSEKYPEIAPTLRTTKDHYHALKEAQNHGNLISLAAFQHVKGLYNVYILDKSPKNRFALTEFAVTLGIPKLAYEIIVDSRTKCQDLTTWDREKDAEGSKGDLGLRAEEQESEQDKAKTDALKMSQDIISRLIAVLLNFTDVHDPFCLACNEAGMVHLFVEMIKELQDTIPHNLKFVNAQTQHQTRFTVRGKVLSRTLGTLHNLSKRVPTRRNFAACHAVNVLVPLLKAEVALYSAKSLLILAYLIDEENNYLIMADEGPIKFLTSLLERSLNTLSHRYIGFSSSELAEGLTQIAVNDSNKKTIAQCGAIPIIVKMLQSAQDDEEKFNACNTLWTLAFDEENRKQIKGDTVAIPELKKLLTSENSEIKKAAAGALWECEGKEKHAEEKQQSVKIQEATGAHVQDTKHVMISYQWDVQTLVIQLKNKLQADGYKVWMDIDEMGGSTLESMAKAVENASVVLVCVSQKYKESPNCRSESNYNRCCGNSCNV
ncbi:uncharacterized protein LOC110050956 isoform X2 [Orbicella faveolata]|uniref:uncharacterized protein LOC110050956 isoform X2 n=1 Tax=Orbicella faveolata TaxID=48498 RepID=UPI0009E3B629|nr:uncharacterized protein LOC110050956 isoform X2 [Orbicella faveolata]